MSSSICFTFIGFRRCTKIRINTLLVLRRVQAIVYPFYAQNCLHIFKQDLQKYCHTAYSRTLINQIWIPKNGKELLDHLKSQKVSLITSIKSSDFSTLTLPSLT